MTSPSLAIASLKPAFARSHAVLLGSLQHADHMLLAVVLCGMGFFGNMAWGPFLALRAQIFSPEVNGKAMGFVNGAGCSFAAFSAKIFAALVTVDALGRKDYTNGWYFIAVCVAAGIFAASWIRTTPRKADPHGAQSAPLGS